jgi:hypothetical protein
MRAALLLVVAACAEGGSPHGATDGGLDACTPQSFYRDNDSDGHGNPAMPMMACAPPAGFVAKNDDCDDSNAERYPGNAELCDGLDNDCATNTTEMCPAGCSPVHDKHVYLFCSNATSWANARTTCASAQFKLVQIEDAAENTFIRNTANTMLGAVDLHIGGSDSAAEGSWIWDGSDPFWTGGSGGTAVMNRYVNWGSGEPNNDNNEDCGEMKASGLWNDGDCGDSQRFICRR